MTEEYGFTVIDGVKIHSVCIRTSISSREMHLVNDALVLSLAITSDNLEKIADRLLNSTLSSHRFSSNDVQRFHLSITKQISNLSDCLSSSFSQANARIPRC